MDEKSAGAREVTRLDAPLTNDSESGRNAERGPEVAGDDDRHLALLLSLKRWKKIVLYCVALTPCILMFGYDYAIVGTSSAMPSFQRDYGILLDDKWILPALWLSLWNFISPLCAMPGAIAAGFLHDQYGRRPSLALGAVFSAIAIAICYVSYLPSSIDARRGVFLAGKGLQGAAIGMVSASTQTYMSEVLPPALRGPILAFFPIFTLVGQLVGALVIFACLDLERGYTICWATQWVFSVLALVVAFVVPESPTYLVRKGQWENAVKAQMRLDRNPGEESERTIKVLRKNIEKERTLAKATYADSFKGANLRRTLIIMFASWLPQLLGMTLLSKASYFLQVVGMSSSLSIIMLILGVVLGLIANICSMWVLSRVGRRRLIMSTLGGLVIVWTTMGIAGFFNTPGAVWYTAISMILTVIVSGIGVWPASYVVSAETSSLQLRGRAQGVAWFSAGLSTAIFAFALPYIYNPDQGNLRGKTGFVFTGLCALGLGLTFLYVPELKGRTPAEIDEMFELRVPTRQFRSWQSAGDSEDERSAA